MNCGVLLNVNSIIWNIYIPTYLLLDSSGKATKWPWILFWFTDNFYLINSTKRIFRAILLYSIQLISMANEIKFTYFDLKVKGEAARLLLAYGGYK